MEVSSFVFNGHQVFVERLTDSRLVGFVDLFKELQLKHTFKQEYNEIGNFLIAIKLINVNIVHIKRDM